ncbi:hypothetical protein PENSPDRAFT_547583, partial [Peniophora sp. CONT]
MFEVIRAVLRRNEEYLNGDAEQEDKAHKLMVQITNSLTVKQEIGAPMASAYLLGFPDHYTNFQYKPFFWRSYVWEKGGNIASYSTIQDYTLRPKKFEKITLYEWIERYKKTRAKKGKPRGGEKADAKEDDGESDDTGLREREGSPDEEELQEQDCGNTRVGGIDDTDDEQMFEDMSNYEPSEAEDIEEPKAKKRKGVAANEKFLPGHPQRDSHIVSLLPKTRSRIPLFVGGLLPRQDQGNLEDFYIAMLTLYKPWRTGADLKSKESSWVDAYDGHIFEERYIDIQKFCNIRYECLDARDDFRQSRKKDDESPFFMHGQFAESLD